MSFVSDDSATAPTAIKLAQEIDPQYPLSNSRPPVFLSK